MKILFLDIDGVLNNHTPHANDYNGICPAMADHLDEIVAATGCRIVLASAWRYMILCGDMTLTGFADVLLTHGVSRRVADAMAGYLPGDVDFRDPHDRGKLAREWLSVTGRVIGVTHAVALDDGDLGYEAVSIASVRPVGDVGLTAQDASRVILLFLSDESKVTK